MNIKNKQITLKVQQGKTDRFILIPDRFRDKILIIIPKGRKK